MGEAKRRRRVDASKPAPKSGAGKFLLGLLPGVSPHLLKLKAAAKLAAMLAAAKLKANFRKWNRREFGERDNDS